VYLYTETLEIFCRKSGPEPVKLAKVDIDVNSLKGLSDLGIDMGFLDSLGMTTSKKRYSLNFGAYFYQKSQQSHQNPSY